MSTRYADPEVLWRFIVTTLTSSTLTCLDHFNTNRVVSRLLNAPAAVTSKVPSDNPEVNIPAADGEPFVSYSNRLLVGFRREAVDPAHPWVCRFHGLIDQVTDEATSDVPETNLAAWDPWQYLYSRPVLNGSGALPGKLGVNYTATRGNVIALDLLLNTILADGPCFIDHTSGTFEATDAIDQHFDQGVTVGEAWKQLTDSGTLDIVLDPIYDPVGRPGICAVMNVYNRAGSQKNEAIFAWDQPSRSLTGITRGHDGSQLANKVQFFRDNNDPVPIQVDAASVTKYTPRWDLEYFAGKTTLSAVELLALTELVLRRHGKTTYALNPAPERAPKVFTEYDIGDEVAIYASSRLREPVLAHKRVFGIPIEIDDNGRETIRELLLAPDSDV